MAISNIFQSTCYHNEITCTACIFARDRNIRNQNKQTNVCKQREISKFSEFRLEIFENFRKQSVFTSKNYK